MGNHGWDETQKAASEVNTDGTFLKLEDDKDKAVVAFLGRPYNHNSIYTGERYLDADTDEGQEYLRENPKKKASFRASMNLYVLERGSGKRMKKVNRVQIFENGVKWFDNLIKIKDKYGLDTWTFELERNGKAKSTKTTYSMLPHLEIKTIEGLRKILEGAELHDLENPMDRSDDDGDEKKASSNGSNGIISDEDKQALVAELKPLGREVLDEFMTEFGVTQLKTLPSSKLDDAKAFIAAKQSGGEKEEAAEVDPFA